MQRIHLCVFSLLVAQPTLTMTLLGCTDDSGSGVVTSNASFEARNLCAAKGCETGSGEPTAATSEAKLPAPFFALRTDSIRECGIRLPLAEALGLHPACEERVDESAPLEVWQAQRFPGLIDLTRSLNRFARETTMDWSMNGDRLETAVWFRSLKVPLQ